MRSDQRQQVRKAGRGRADRRALRLDHRQCPSEDDQGGTPRKRRRTGKDSVEACGAGGGGDRLGDRVVIGDEFFLLNADGGANGWIGQVEHHEDDVHPADATTDLERVDSLIQEVPEQLGPRSLFLTGRVPDTRLARSVESARALRRVGARQEVVLGRALVPVPADDASPRGRLNRVGQAHT